MRYSLLSRFQGTFCGSVLGELWGLNLPELSRGQFPSALTSGGWYDFAIASTHNLLKANLTERVATSPSPAALGAIVPIACFYHENRLLLQQQLASLGQSYAFTPEVQLNAVILSQILALIFKEQLLVPLNVLPHLIEQFNSELEHLDSKELLPQLHHLQTLLEQGATLEAVESQLNHSCAATLSMLRALYCFLSTPEDFRLVVLRSARTSKTPQLTSAIAGMLAGAYNSFSGIPLSWRLGWHKLSQVQGTQPDLHHLSQLAHHLWAAWSGSYYATAPALQSKDAQNLVSDPVFLNVAQLSAIAAPQTLRPR
ncbi:MAG: ADP-ribosylglycohydrolase family protein [Desertifilum sp. SIO1I2]|nr:ADP-ribosylglycohydrolase family protein [Desertifilum sp. SIO1I2]